MISKATRDDRVRSTAVYEGATADPIEQHGYGIVVSACSVVDEGADLDVLYLKATTTQACLPEGGVVLRWLTVSGSGNLVYTMGSRQQRWYRGTKECIMVSCASPFVRA